jgi:hypothetical protein
MTEEKDRVLGLEPVAKFLHSARSKSGNNLVQLRPENDKADDAWQFTQLNLPI